MNKYRQDSKVRQNWTCVRKTRYESEEAAQASIDPAGPVELTTYHCPFCEGWHRAQASKARTMKAG